MLIHVYETNHDGSHPNGVKISLGVSIYVQLRKWADVLVIAPLDANTMAKMAHGHVRQPFSEC